MHPWIALVSLWLAWGISWVAAALWATPAAKRPGFSKELAYRVLMVSGAFVLAVPAHGYEGFLRLWHIGWLGAWLCVVGVALGIAFAWWARIHLGKLWSGNVTKKADHHIVDTGPYGLVRHPIYTGLLFAVLATALAKGTILGAAGLLLIGVGVFLKARLEERWLSQELGPELYEGYRCRVPMLVPGWPAGHS